VGTSAPEFIVGIGGSAGGLVAYTALLHAMPAKMGMAFVVVSHILPTANSQLASILSRHTSMPVMVASTAMPIQRNHVYICPPNADLSIEGLAFKVVSPRVRGNVQIDGFFSSLAEAMEARAIGIIVSGYAADGTEGCKQIKARGGTTFADLAPEVNEMPLSAQAAGAIDFVLPLGKIPQALRRLQRAQRSRP